MRRNRKPRAETGSGGDDELTGVSLTRLQPRDDDAWCSHARLSVYLRRRVRTFLVTQFVRLGCAPRGAQNPVIAGENGEMAAADTTRSDTNLKL